MNIAPIEALLQNADEETVRAFLHDQALVFWVDWSEEDHLIANSCEHVLQTGALRGELVDTDTQCGYEVHIVYKNQRAIVPLSYSPNDRHITLCALNQAIRKDFEIRFCLDSNGACTLAFLPLPVETWRKLEENFGDAVGRHFYALAEHPNLFTEEFPPKITWQELAANADKKLDAIRLYREQHNVGLGEAKRTIESFIEKSR